MYDTGRIVRNAFRISKVRGESAIRIRVPGGYMQARYLSSIQTLAEKFGNGTVHLTTRQGYEIPGVKLNELDAIRSHMAEVIALMEKECGVTLENPQTGYPESGTRNVCACIGNRVCQFANADTTAIAQKIESVIYPNKYHLKIAVTGCPNDCIKAHMQDIGVIANVIPDYDHNRCIGCEACVEVCREKATNALSIDEYYVERSLDYCIKCGECVLKCPTGAQYRNRTVFTIILGGRTGKLNPRLATAFVKNAAESTLLGICRNVYRYIDTYIDHRKSREHLGYIIDRTGWETFRDMALQGLILDKEELVVRTSNPGYTNATRP